MTSTVAEQLTTSETTEPVDLTTSSPHSLHRAVYARRAEYTRAHRMRVKVGTWNVAACPGTDKDLASWFVSGRGIDTKLANLSLKSSPALEAHWSTSSAGDDPEPVRLVGGDKIGLYVLGLQEVVNLNPVTQYVYSEPNPAEKWRMALEAALPEGYEFVASEQMSGLLLLVYASPEVAATIGNVSTKSAATGVGGWFGNKGATTARLILGETTKMVFVNSHLSSGNDASTLDRRCWDAKAIVDRVRFDPITRSGGMDDENPDKIGDEDFAFWFGDLNFRLDGIPGHDIRRILTLHTRGEYDLNKAKGEGLEGEGIIVMRTSDSSDDQTDGTSSIIRSADQDDDDDSVSLPDPDEFDPDPHQDPASLQATLNSLLSHDQLMRTMKERKAFHDGWREGPISFLPSYKYDVGSVGLFDSSEKKRAPSWCDRILYRARADKERYETKVREEEEARKKDEEMKARGMDHAGEDDEVLFDYDPENEEERSPAGKAVFDYDVYDEGDSEAGDAIVTTDDLADRIGLDIYTSHQRIMSSDHKPIVAMFTLDYDAIVPELKAQVQAEVARELDRAENEGRPGITIVKEGRDSGDESVEIGEIGFLERRSASLTLANTGRVPATFGFVENPTPCKAGNDSVPPHWLTTSFSRSEMSHGSSEAIDLGKEVTLEPGEAVSALLEVFIDQASHARLLNDGHSTLEDVLVLTVTDGRDHFIPVRATWVPTCIGRSIEELIRVPDGGIRAFVEHLSKQSNQQRHVGAIPYELEVHCAAPKELFKLTEAVEILMERTLADEQMLQGCGIPRDNPGWPFEGFVTDSHADLLPSIIDVLDRDLPIADAFAPEVPAMQRLETAAEALVLFLQGLTDGIVSMPLWSRVETAPIGYLGQAAVGVAGPSIEDDKNTILDILSSAPNHNICFVFLTTTLAKVIAELAPLSRANVDALKATNGANGGTQSAAATAVGGGIAAIRRSMSFRRGMLTSTNATAMAEAMATLDRRRARERRVAEVFGRAVCRAPVPERERERRAMEEKVRGFVELFLRGRDRS